MEIAGWLQRFFPAIGPASPWEEACWVAEMRGRSPEHHPPLYWLGRALDAVAEGGDAEALGARLLAVHGETACDGWTEQDERVQDVLTEACAYAWAAARLGPARFVAGRDAPLLVRVESHEAFVAPRRLRPVRTMEQLLQLVAHHTEQAAHDLPTTAGRIVYLDVYLNSRMYAQEVGYREELTEPLRAAARHFAAEHRLGLVLTRPFQWGNPIEAEY